MVLLLLLHQLKVQVNISDKLPPKADCNVPNPIITRLIQKKQFRPRYFSPTKMAQNPFELGPALLTQFQPSQVLDWCSLSKTNSSYCEREYFLSAAKLLPGYDEDRLWFTYPTSKSNKPKLTSNRLYYLMCVSLFTSNPSVAINFVHYLYAAKMAIIFGDLPSFIELYAMTDKDKTSDYVVGGKYLIKYLAKYGHLDWLIHIGIGSDDFDETKFVQYIYDNPNIEDAYEISYEPYNYYSPNFAANIKKFNNITLFPDLLTDNGLFIYYTLNGDLQLRKTILDSIESIEPDSFEYLSVDEAVEYESKIDHVEILTWIILDNHWNYFVEPYSTSFFAKKSLSAWNRLWFSPIALNITGATNLTITKFAISPIYYHYYKFAIKNGIKFNTDDATYWSLVISLMDPKYRATYKPVLSYKTYYASGDPVDQKLQELSLDNENYGIAGKYYNLLYTLYTDGRFTSDAEFVPTNVLLEKYGDSYIMGFYNTISNNEMDYTTFWDNYVNYPNSPMADAYITYEAAAEDFDMSFILIADQNYSEDIGLHPFNKLYAKVDLKRFFDGYIPKDMEEYPQFVLKALFRKPEAAHLNALEHFYSDVETIPQSDSIYWLYYAPLIDDEAFKYLLPKLSVPDLSDLIPMTFALAPKDSSNLASLTRYIIEKLINVTLPAKTYVMYQSAISPVWKSFASQIWTDDQIEELFDFIRSSPDTLDITLNYIDHDTYF